LLFAGLAENLNNEMMELKNVKHKDRLIRVLKTVNSYFSDGNQKEIICT